MKTAMIELRDKLIEVKQSIVSTKSQDYLSGYRDALRFVAKDIEKNMLEVEREQVLEAFIAGSERGTRDIPFNAEQYYTQTFK